MSAAWVRVTEVLPSVQGTGAGRRGRGSEGGKGGQARRRVDGMARGGRRSCAAAQHPPSQRSPGPQTPNHARTGSPLAGIGREGRKGVGGHGGAAGLLQAKVDGLGGDGGGGQQQQGRGNEGEGPQGQHVFGLEGGGGLERWGACGSVARNGWEAPRAAICGLAASERLRGLSRPATKAANPGCRVARGSGGVTRVGGGGEGRRGAARGSAPWDAGGRLRLQDGSQLGAFRLRKRACGLLVRVPLVEARFKKQDGRRKWSAQHRQRLVRRSAGAQGRRRQRRRRLELGHVLSKVRSIS